MIKKMDRQLRRSGAGSYPEVALLRLQFHLNLNVSSSSGSGKNGLLRDSGSELQLKHPGIEEKEDADFSTNWWSN